MLRPFSGFRLSSWRGHRAFARDRHGTVAIETALVMMPFLMLVFGVTAIGLYFLTSYMLEHGVDQTARIVRTCSYKSANGGAGISTLDLKNTLCENAPGFVSCDDKLRVQATTVASFSAVSASAMSATSCIDGAGNLVSETANATTQFNVPADSIVVLSACYQYDLGGYLPFLNLGRVNGSNKNFIRAATAFKVEPQPC